MGDIDFTDLILAENVIDDVVESLDLNESVCAKEWWLIYAPHISKQPHIQSNPLERKQIQEIKNAGGCVRHPDFMITRTMDGKNYIPQLIIEIDGSVHDNHTFKTEQRNNDYEFMKLPYIVINKSDCSTQRLDWRDVLRSALTHKLCSITELDTPHV